MIPGLSFASTPVAAAVCNSTTLPHPPANRILTRVHSSDPNAKPDVREDGVALATEALRQSVQDFFSSKRTAMRKSLLLNVIREWAPETGALLLPTLIKFASEGRRESRSALC